MLFTDNNIESWWKCAEGHEFQRSVYDRINRLHDCPVCNRTIVVQGVNDFLHAYPKVAEIRDYETNDRKPNEISDQNNDKYNYRKASEFTDNNCYQALWIYPTCHGEYAARICDHEVGDDSCPFCSNKKVLPDLTHLKKSIQTICW